jgi:hypothetical protein
MYSHEDRMKAINLYVKYDFSAADTVGELGYPSRKMLVRWYKEYEETGELHGQYDKQPKYSPEQMREAVEYYLDHGLALYSEWPKVGTTKIRNPLSMGFFDS